MKASENKHQELIDQGYVYRRGFYLNMKTREFAIALSDEELVEFKAKCLSAGVDINDSNAVGNFIFKNFSDYIDE